MLSLNFFEEYLQKINVYHSNKFKINSTRIIEIYLFKLDVAWFLSFLIEIYKTKLYIF